MSKTLELSQKLIACASVSPNDAGCQEIISEILINHGFIVEELPFGDVKNIWARKGLLSPLLLFVGHTDVVPVGNIEHWDTSPFIPTIKGDYLYGRGAADMKGGLAAMIIATEIFLEKHTDYKGSIGFIITSGEEQHTLNGTSKVIDWLIEQNVHVDWCLVGEPTSKEIIGDSIKIGRRGSLTCNLKILGTLGHVAHPYRANNPIHKFAAVLQELIETEWDKGNKYFPPTSLQFSNINAGVGVSNVIPEELTCSFNLRFSNELTAELIINKIEDILKKHHLVFNISWDIQGHPFLSRTGNLLTAVQDSIREVTGIQTLLSTDGGTSDARFVTATGAQIIELGLCNTSIHSINECIKVEDLDKLNEIYVKILEKLLV